MQHSPSSEANSSSASQEIPHILWNQKVHYRIHNSPPPVPILSQLDPVHPLTPHFLKIHLNIILSSTPGSPKWSLTYRFVHQNSVYASPLHHTRYIPRQSHYSQFDQLKNIWWAVQIINGSGSVVGVPTGYGLDGPGIESRWGRDFPHLSKLALGPTQPPVQWIPSLSRG